MAGVFVRVTPGGRSKPRPYHGKIRSSGWSQQSHLEFQRRNGAGCVDDDLVPDAAAGMNVKNPTRDTGAWGTLCSAYGR
jgi:hypothetical protein